MRKPHSPRERGGSWTEDIDGEYRTSGRARKDLDGLESAPLMRISLTALHLQVLKLNSADMVLANNISRAKVN